MEYKRRSHNGRWIQKILISLVFGLFTVRAKADGLFPPTITAQPLGTSVQNGGTASLSVSAECLLSVISSVTWYCNGKPISATNATVSYGGLLGLTSISSTLTINQASAANSGTYTVVVENALGGYSTGGPAQFGIIPAITDVTNETGMVSSGFKVQFSGPVGSNLVIQASSDLNHWSPVYTNVVTANGLSYTDTVAKTVSCRFYRAKLK